MSKLCVIYNMAAKYRAPIFQLMDKELDVDWYFGEPIGDIKELDTSILKKVTKLKQNTFRCLTWQKGVLKLLISREYNYYLMLGEPFTLSTWAILLSRPLVARKKKIYFWSHGWYGRENAVKRWIKKTFFGLADGTFLYGNYAKKVAIEQGNDENKFWVIHNSLDYNRHLQLRAAIQPSSIYSQHFGNDNPTLIFIGRLTKVKKLNQVIEALALLKQKGYNYNLVFIGDGEEREALVKLAKEKNVDVWFYGSCYDEKTNAELIYNADLCVSPGNVGLTAIHTMTFGTPVITHSNFANQMPEFEAIQQGKTGDFFKEGSVDSLANAIVKWFSSNTYSRESIRQACYQEIDQSWTPQFQLSVLKNYVS